MTVKELIAELSKMPPDMPVCVWDAEEDDNVEVLQVLLEHGHTSVDLLTFAVDVVESQGDDR